MAGHFKHGRAFLRFCLAYLPVSLLIVVLLLFFTYRDLVGLILKMNFLSGGQQYSESSRQMLLGGFHTRLAEGFADRLPLMCMAILAVLMAYVLMNVYRHTYRSLVVNRHYVNVKKIPAANITLHYVVVFSASFVVPLLYWSLLLMVWLPQLAKVPLQYVLGGSTPLLITACLGVLVALLLLTHMGLVMTRLSMRLFKYE